MSLFTKLLLSGIVSNQLEVPLTIEQESLLGILLLLLLLNSPLVTKHSLLISDQFLFLLALNFTCLFLPVEDSHGVPDLLLLLTGFLHFTLQFLLCVKLP